MDRFPHRHPVDVVPDHSLFLRDPQDLRFAARPLEDPSIARLASPFRIEEGRIEYKEVGSVL